MTSCSCINSLMPAGTTHSKDTHGICNHMHKWPIVPQDFLPASAGEELTHGSALSVHARCPPVLQASMPGRIWLAVDAELSPQLELNVAFSTVS
jgi:hypothetical protein